MMISKSVAHYPPDFYIYKSIAIKAAYVQNITLYAKDVIVCDINKRYICVLVE